MTEHTHDAAAAPAHGEHAATPTPPRETPEAAPPRVYRPVAREPVPLDLEAVDDEAAAAAARFERPPRNGAYQGPLPVRVLRTGVDGELLRLEAERLLVKGAVWIRGGEQRVRIEKATPTKVRFRELTHGAALRTLDRGKFLSQGKPE